MAELSKDEYKALEEELSLPSKSVWEKADQAQRDEIFKLAGTYMRFLDEAKTERLAVGYITRLAEEAGFKPLGQGGRKFYAAYKNKAIALAVLGKRPVAQGVRIIGAHIDAPRLDLKMHPLYENQELAFLKTHYYGGIKKYQWLARPLALHGVVCKADGTTAEIHLGDEADDPVFTVLDLLPHLSRKSQEGKKLSEAFEAERMNLLVGGLPLDSEEGKDKVKLAVLKLLKDTHGITESDLISAELEVVPAGKARDVGLDRALIGAYGQDDRASAFCGLMAALEQDDPEVPCLAIFLDKEEIGSDGATSAKGRLLENMVASMMEAAGEPVTYLGLSRALGASQALSADVNAAFDPDYPEVHEKLNAAYMGHGVTLTKYTGSGGKYGASDADAEYVAWLRRVWDGAEVTWQAAGMGKVDEGGGGTIAKHMAEYGMNVVDVGPALLSMHSPFEISHKADIWASVAAFRAFFAAPAA